MRAKEKQQRKQRHAIASAIRSAFRALVKQSRAEALRRSIDRQRELYRADPAFKARKLQAKKRYRARLAELAGRTLMTREQWRLEQQRRAAERTGIADRDERLHALRKVHEIKRERAKRTTRIEPVSILRVAERDGWICGICGKKVKRTEWSMDHVVPLSKGGGHTYANIVLAHHLCNSRRGAGRLPVQASLLAAVYK